MSNRLEEALEFLQGKKSVVVTAHERPDGDALGAAVALRRVLNGAGINARIVGLQPVHPRYSFMLEEGEIAAPTENWLDGADALVALDCGNFDRIGKFSEVAPGKVPILNIDHHASNTLFGTVNWVDEHASSCGEMVFRLARQAGWEISPGAAEAMWVAMLTDTGRFCFENTNPGVMRIGAELLELGARCDVVERNVYQSVPLKEFELTRRAMQTLQLEENGQVASVSLTREDLAELRCSAENAQDIINLPRSIVGVKIALFFYEFVNSEFIKVSVRTIPPYDATKLCKGFGGGGHARAAGCKVAGTIAQAREKVLERIHAIWFSSPGGK